ncbi:hypothetical protein BT93_F2920 [Corymbia citriodora subsp. variegata]|nr:hypothetical protein BT93_F2920 [Corymbia citriodora subsp. variegata]
MGCNSSKLDRLPAVSLCRDRTKLLEDALLRSYALADAHVAYLHSLHSFGAALRRLSDQSPPHTDGGRSSKSPAHVGAARPDRSPSSSSSTSSSGSHIHFDDSEDDNDDNSNNDVTSSTVPLLASDARAVGEPDDYYNPESLNPFFEKFVSISYMKNQPTQSTTHTLPVYDHYHDHNETSQIFYYRSSQHDGHLVSKAPPPPPPPPPPPRDSTWDILNFFDGYDGYAEPVASHDRAKEESKVPKEITQGDHGGTAEEAEAVQRENVKSNYYVKAPSVSVSEKVEPKETSSCSAEPKDEGSRRDVSEIVKEVESLFKAASESGDKVSSLLDLAKFRYHHKNGVYQAPSKTTLHAMATSRASLAAKAEGASAKGDGDRDADAVWGSPGNFSGTLKKLCMWEKKLYREVKAEEKLRIMYGRKCRELNQMSNKGADAAKIEATRAMTRALSTKLQIAIHVIHKISVKANKLRDDELWPWIHQLVHGWSVMWKSMEECHRSQYKAVAKAKNLDLILSTPKQDDADHLQELVQIKLEIQNWTLCFSNWVFAQKGCIRALNSWLMRCLSSQEPEQTPDGVAPFSPSRIGAPPVFVICNQWSQSLDSLTEKEVVDTMKELLSNVNRKYKQHYATLQQKIPADKEMERKVKLIERKEQKIHKEMQAKDRSAVLKFREDSAAPLSARGEVTTGSSVQSCLKHIFKALEIFSADSARACEELCTRAKEYPQSRQSSKRF